MSTLKDRVTEDMKAAMRAKDSDRLSTIRMLLAACKQREVDERIVLDDAAVIGLADKESAEVKVLEAYLPQRMSADEVQAAIDAIVVELGAKGPGDMGKVMAAAKSSLAGKAEMGQVSAAVKQALAKAAA
jgi:uncharacterized protein